MGNSKTAEHSATSLTEHFDVLIVGAGISGIGGAYHLQDQCPDKSFAVLEAQDSFGGTWRTHKYPGIRSDSDLYTFGYRFKPWTSAPIATAAEITKYMGEVIDENKLASHIRYGHVISSASWSTEEKMWHLSVSVNDTNERLKFSCNFLWMCQGYYRHSEGYTPSWPGVQDFQGDIIHPQTWPENFDYSGKKVVVIGSGATAATLIPAMAEKCSHITMLQRSPTYFATGRNAIEVADMLRELEIPEEWVHEIVRKKILLEQEKIAQMSREHPELVKAELFKGIKQFLPDDYDIDQHFTPSYRPWHQRIAFVPDGDLFKRIADGTASVVTEEIQTFQANGILLKSGDVLEADVIITATGFNLNVLGDIDFDIDSKPLNFSESITYRGAMFTGIPNMAWVFGYFRASWTLRADLIGDFVCRLLNHMDETGSSVAVPELRAEDNSMKLLPWVDPEDFNPGYLQRSVHLLPQQGDTDPWRHAQDYWTEKDLLPIADLDDGALSFR